MKTGYTGDAKYCLTSTAMKNDIRFITVVMGVDTSEYRSADTTSMLNYGFTNYKLNTIIKKSNPIAEISVAKGKRSSIVVYPKEQVTDLIKIYIKIVRRRIKN